MHPIVAIGIAIVLMMTGSVAAVRPTLLSQFQEDADTSPEEAVRQVRIGGVFMFLFGIALLYAILTAKGPPEFIGV